MASDSQASEDDQTKFDIPKLWSDHGLLFGYSGNTAVRWRREQSNCLATCLNPDQRGFLVHADGRERYE
jgi:hypothetical protein